MSRSTITCRSSCEFITWSRLAAVARASASGAAPAAAIGTWPASGFYLSLGPPLAVLVIGSPNLAWGDPVIFLRGRRAAPGAAVAVCGRVTQASRLLFIRTDE